MILGWSPHQTGTAHGEPIRYLMSPEIEKQINGRTVVVKRRPVPELLLGEPELFLKALRRLPVKNRYRVATMTFNTDEICPDRFNQGEPFLRAAVASCIEAFLEFSFAGLPAENRLPFVVGTHSHTGKLEINFALPRGIFNPHGKVLSFNPHPPMRGSRDDFDHLTDMLNHNFGWTDPRDPDRMRRLKTAGWIEKRAAEALRNGVTPCPLEDPITHLWVNLRALAYDMEHPSDLVSALSRELPEVGMKIDKITAKSITIAGQSGKQKMCLRGSLVDGIGPCSLHDVQKRAEYLAEAHDRVAASWAKRVAWNSARYSKSMWAVPTPDFRALLSRPSIAIPQQHPAKLVLSGRMTPKLTGVFRILIERLSRLKSDILTRLGQVKIVTSLSKSLLQPLRTLNTELEKINAQYARTQGSPYQRRGHPGDDFGTDPAIDRSSGRKRHWTDGRADQRIDYGAEPDGEYHRQAAPDTRTDIDTGAAPLADRGITGPAAQPVDRARRKVALWHAAKRAVKEVFPDADATCYLIVPGHPAAVAIKAPDWRIIMADGAVTCTHGELSLSALDNLRDAVALRMRGGLPVLQRQHPLPGFLDDTPDGP
jgi:hypothetical protein